uniref:P2X purinoceptor n=1 Tax=Esox lucius TaxID=8010 RepID=A0AAY5KI28_ESOLU
MSKPWGWVTGFFTYETTKSVVVKSWSVGIINRVVQLLIILYFVCYVFYREKAYQVRDSGIQSSVMTKVKGFGYVNNHVMDVADYVAPTQGSAVFCIITKLIVTENQFQGRCPEVSPVPALIRPGPGTKTMLSNPRPPVSGAAPFLPVGDSIPSLHFSVVSPRPHRGNFPSSLNKTYIRSCRYDSSHNRHCPIFKVGDVLRYTGQNLSTIGHTGGEIGINIQWLCNLDLSEERCEPHYSFTRLDAVFEKNRVSKGYNFRFAKYYKSENGTDFRTLHKAYAIRFDILVTGLAGKFDPIPTLINIVAAFTSVGLGSILCDLILLNFLTGADQYKARKFEEVSESQIKILLSQKSISQQSVKPVSNDSGAVSLNLDQQL